MIPTKQGAEIALNVIIFAVIGLLVLVVVLFIFGGKADTFSKGVSQCTSLQGSCSETRCSDLDPPRPAIPNGDCNVAEGAPPQYCCSTVFG